MIARVKTSHTAIRALRIALIAPVHGVRPPLAGGSVQLVCRLAERLAARGHDVTVLGTGEPDPPGRVFYDWIDTRRSTTSRDDPFLAEALHSVDVDRLLDGSDFDVVHDHTLTGPLLVHRHHAATLHTVYGTVPDSVGVLPTSGALRLRLLAVSDHQRTLAPNRGWLGTVHPDQPQPQGATGRQHADAVGYGAVHRVQGGRVVPVDEQRPGQGVVVDHVEVAAVEQAVHVDRVQRLGQERVVPAGGGAAGVDPVVEDAPRRIGLAGAQHGDVVAAGGQPFGQPADELHTAARQRRPHAVDRGDQRDA